MKVIESKIEGKKSPESCEDGLVVTADFIAVIDGFPISRERVKVVSLNTPQKKVEQQVSTDVSDTLAHSARAIVLASDGYPFLKPTLSESEEALAHLIAHDPQCTHEFIATKGLVEGNKSFDDRTYVRFQI